MFIIIKIIYYIECILCCDIWNAFIKLLCKRKNKFYFDLIYVFHSSESIF